MGARAALRSTHEYAIIGKIRAHARPGRASPFHGPQTPPAQISLPLQRRDQDGPLRLIVGGRYSLDFAIALEIDKRLNHLPLDRQRRQMEREGLVISTQSMWDLEDALADLMEPSYLKLLEYILGDDVIGADETHWRLMQPGSTAKWWVWCSSRLQIQSLSRMRQQGASRWRSL